MKAFLEATPIIDFDNPAITALAKSLLTKTESETIKNCFEWVRDNIKHSGEFKLNPVTYKASDVLKHKTGFCFAKSHLLASLLRSNDIPTGFCYQCLSMDALGAPFCLHGLNAVFLKDLNAWYRLDPRGNNTQVNAQFCPPKEQLAFPVNLKKETDYFEVCAEPLPEVISLLKTSMTYEDVFDQLPSTAMVKPKSNIKINTNMKTNEASV
jgi:hypothetical protein